MTNSNTDKYYNEVGNYFDIFAEKHYNKSIENPILSGMRNSFRSYVTHANPEHVLDIGCGPGEDSIFFAEKYPNANVYGIDVSAKMVGVAESMAKDKNLTNTKFLNVGIEQLENAINANIKFDVIYVFFGALNTVSSLDEAAQTIDRLLKPGGQAVLTFVNKYYLSEFFVNLLKGRVKKATARWGKEWLGYSPEVKLSSKTYTPSQIRSSFKHMKLMQQRGYSIFYPAWYQAAKVAGKPGLDNTLKKMDVFANKTPLWKNGEYTLFVYEKN